MSNIHLLLNDGQYDLRNDQTIDLLDYLLDVTLLIDRIIIDNRKQLFNNILYNLKLTRNGCARKEN